MSAAGSSSPTVREGRGSQSPPTIKSLQSNFGRPRVRVPDEIVAQEYWPPLSSLWRGQAATFLWISVRVPRIVARLTARLPRLGLSENQKRSFQSGSGSFLDGRISR